VKKGITSKVRNCTRNPHHRNAGLGGKMGTFPIMLHYRGYKITAVIKPQSGICCPLTFNYEGAVDHTDQKEKTKKHLLIMKNIREWHYDS
jgi:hypothetical protein